MPLFSAKKKDATIEIQNQQNVKPLLKALKEGKLDRNRLRRNIYDMAGALATHLRKLEEIKHGEHHTNSAG